MKKIQLLLLSFCVCFTVLHAQTVTTDTFVKKIRDFEVFTNSEVFIEP